MDRGIISCTNFSYHIIHIIGDLKLVSLCGYLLLFAAIPDQFSEYSESHSYVPCTLSKVYPVLCLKFVPRCMKKLSSLALRRTAVVGIYSRGSRMRLLCPSSAGIATSKLLLWPPVVVADMVKEVVAVVANTFLCLAVI